MISTHGNLKAKKTLQISTKNKYFIIKNNNELQLNY